MIGFVHPRGCGHLVAKHSQISFPVSVSRANQFDAASFDVEMSAMLEEQLVKVFSLTKEMLLLLLPLLNSSSLKNFLHLFSKDKKQGFMGEMNLYAPSVKVAQTFHFSSFLAKHRMQ
ncbi:hypothetical protein MLD38_005239 [Melastoma candidum]|uniref:Uncharacterized protein n=1 Tax=Melastoma candidum TaxID=119954 RepID=A0ACB9S848_9MYRT|nr:hypothetical protein MLD38_005239 [Melastoma candidum]